MKPTVKQQGSTAAGVLLLSGLYLFGGIAALFVLLFGNWNFYVAGFCILFSILSIGYGVVSFIFGASLYRKFKQNPEFYSEFKGVFAAILLVLWLIICAGCWAL